MTRITDPCHPETVRVVASHQAQARQIAAELAAIAATGMILPGSITQAAHPLRPARLRLPGQPARLHGPYWQWTRKVAARTVCRWLSPAQRADYQAWIDNNRRLRDLARPARGPRRCRPRNRPPVEARAGSSNHRNRANHPITLWPRHA